ncbi:hypothetical protein BCR32DRAFT_328625 [Anaeromyces robustus]|jgi:hypothetical protein|uniref:PH-domain-containing protein n=1 Tax=Anaeromyces robustus TaxID=1754192 RepID=A0A1Y1WYE2_9FUNG|nr:hypothetical protein BCR32DRAFT_328625 [Anaeromyces robustus]|eukprot:ORX78216.1 hypothetical protein BCR32DRAFT_328625 [Anaeromyces robustus]
MVRKNGPLIVYGKYPFEMEQEDEISFQIGDPILVLEKDEEFNDGWWKGRTLNGEIGLFPVNFITTENIFNVNVSTFYEYYANNSNISDHAYVPNIIDDDDLNEQPIYESSSEDENSKSIQKSIESANSFNNYENNPSSSEGSVSSMRALSSPQMSVSLPNNFRMLGGDLNRMESSKPKIINSSQTYSLSQPPTNSQTYSLSQPPINSQTNSFSQPPINSQTNSFSQPPINSQTYSLSQPPIQRFSQSQNSLSRISSSNHVKKPQDWSVEEVCEWLSKNNHESLIEHIKKDKINGSDLLELNLAKLRAYGIHSLTERIGILHEILNLKEEFNDTKLDFRHLHSSNSSSISEFETDEQKKDNHLDKLQKENLNFSNEYYEKSENEINEEQNISKSNTPNEGPIYNPNNNEKVTFHELPATPQSINSVNSSNKGLGGMVTSSTDAILPLPPVPSVSPPNVSNVPTPVSTPLSASSSAALSNTGNRIRFFSLHDEVTRTTMIPTGNKFSRSISVSHTDKYASSTKINLKNADRKGWLEVHLDDEPSWKKRWVVLLDNRLFILASPDTDEDKSLEAIIPKAILSIELNPSYEILPDNSDSFKKHTFLLQDPKLGGIHLAAESQLSVVTWITFLVHASTNTKRKPLPLIPLKNIGRQAREPLLNTQAISTLTFEKVEPEDSKNNRYSIYEDNGKEFINPAMRKNSISMSVNGIISPNIETSFDYSKFGGDDSFGMRSMSPIGKNKAGSVVSNSISKKNQISLTQSAAAVANGWYRTNARSATDYSNYRNVQRVSEEERIKLQKSSNKYTAADPNPVSLTPILDPTKTVRINLTQTTDIDDDNMSLNEAGMMSFMSNKSEYSSGKNGLSFINSSMSKKGHTSISSNFTTYSVPGNLSQNQLSSIDIMKQRGISNFTTNYPTKRMVDKSEKKKAQIYW